MNSRKYSSILTKKFLTKEYIEKNRKLHQRAYEYLVDINKVEDYLKWFDKKYKLK